MSTLPDPCDPEVFEHGTAFLMLGHWKGESKDIEIWCRKVAEVSGQRVDWHFMGGRAVFRVLGDEEKARSIALELLPEVGCEYEGFKHARWL